MSERRELFGQITVPYGQAGSLSQRQMLTRSPDPFLSMVSGDLAGWSIVYKFGRNDDVDVVSAPEDVWIGGGVYTGFPVGDVETVEVFSSSANDTSAGSGARTVTISGLDGDFLEQSETIALNGTTPVVSSNTYSRVNKLIVETSGGDTAFNDGNLTVRHTTTTANVFVTAPAGFGQSQVCAFTVPADKTGFVIRLSVDVNRSNSAIIDGGLWIREFNKAPRLIRIFSASDSDRYIDVIQGGIEVSAKTDLVVRVTSTSALNVEVTANMDIILKEIAA